MRRIAPVAAIALAFAITPILAAEIELESEVAAATLYPQGATVERRAEFEAKSGRHTLLVVGLPAQFRRETLRVLGAAGSQGGAAPFRILSIDQRSADAKALQQRRKGATEDIDRAIQALQDRMFFADNALKAAQAQQKFIASLAEAQARASTDGNEHAAPVQPENWSQMWSSIGEGTKQARDNEQRAKIERREISKQINELNAQRNDAGVQRSFGPVLAVEIEATAAVKGALTVRYQIDAASWSPVYDARLSTGEKPEIQLTRRARVTQRSGEDWEDIALTLSTARPTGRASAPDPRLLFAQIREQQVESYDAGFTSTYSSSVSVGYGSLPQSHPDLQRMITKRVVDRPASVRRVAIPGKTRSVTINGVTQTIVVEEASETLQIVPPTYKTVTMTVGEAMGYGQGDGAVPAPAPEPQPVVVAPYAVPAQAYVPPAAANTSMIASLKGETVQYAVPDPADVSGSGTPKQLLIDEIDLATTLELRATPSLDPAAYLYAEYKNEGDAPILPGQASLYRDDVFVGQTPLSKVAAGDEAFIPFGPSESVKLSHREIERKEGEEGLIRARQTEHRAYEITAQNLDSRAVVLVLRDSMPYAENEDIEITLIADPEPAKRDADDQKGTLVWRLDLAGAATRTIAFSYDVEYPTGTELILPR